MEYISYDVQVSKPLSPSGVWSGDRKCRLVILFRVASFGLSVHHHGRRAPQGYESPSRWVYAVTAITLYICWLCIFKSDTILEHPLSSHVVLVTFHDLFTRQGSNVGSSLTHSSRLLFKFTRQLSSVQSGSWRRRGCVRLRPSHTFLSYTLENSLTALLKSCWYINPVKHHYCYYYYYFSIREGRESEKIKIKYALLDRCSFRGWGRLQRLSSRGKIACVWISYYF